jgi:hypothetical protein
MPVLRVRIMFWGVLMPGDVEPCPNDAPHERHLWFVPGTIPDPAYTNECPGVRP